MNEWKIKVKKRISMVKKLKTRIKINEASSQMGVNLRRRIMMNAIELIANIEASDGRSDSITGLANSNLKLSQQFNK